MKIRKRIIVNTLIFSVLIGGGYAAAQLREYVRIADELPSYSVATMNSDTLGIGVIGDSWASIHKRYDQQFLSMLTASLGDTIPVKVYSSGKGGAKSKLIYTNMFEEKDVNPQTYKGIRTSRPVIMHHPKYCVVFAGTNDAVCKMGKVFYAEHTVMIARHLLNSGIKPILVTIPSVDLDKAYEDNWKNKPLRWVTRMITGSKFYCLEEYRNELKEKLRKDSLADKVLLIDIAEISSRKGFLGKDGVHPSPNGFRQLDSMIVKTITDNENRIQ